MCVTADWTEHIPLETVNVFQADEQKLSLSLFSPRAMLIFKSPQLI